MQRNIAPSDVIQSLWIGSELSNNEILCLESFIFHGHIFHLYTYDSITNIPSGVVVKDASEIISKNLIFKDSLRSLGSFADWFRLKLLDRKGGWWVDMDMICLNPFKVEMEYCFSSERQYNMGLTDISNSCIKAPAGSPLLGELIDIVEERVFSSKQILWGELGVSLFRQMFKTNADLQKFIVAPEVFCPINYFDISELICKPSSQFLSHSSAIHLWNEIWRRGNLNKNAIYHPDSLYEMLKRKYLK